MEMNPLDHFSVEFQSMVLVSASIQFVAHFDKDKISQQSSNLQYISCFNAPQELFPDFQLNATVEQDSKVRSCLYNSYPLTITDSLDILIGDSVIQS